MPDIFPVSIQAAGTVKVSFVPTLANPATPTLTELNGTDALDLSPYFRADQFALAVAQDKQDDTRLSDLTRREALAVPAVTIDALRYLYNPQATAAAQGNKAFDTLKEGVTGYFVLRYGSKTLPSSAAWAASQRIGYVLSVSLGFQLQTIPTGDNAVHTIEQNVTVTVVAQNVTLPST